MYDILQAQVDRLAGKMDFVKKKKHLKPACLSGFLTLGRAVCQTIGLRSTIRFPLKTLGYNGSN